MPSSAASHHQNPARSLLSETRSSLQFPSSGDALVLVAGERGSWSEQHPGPMRALIPVLAQRFSTCAAACVSVFVRLYKASPAVLVRWLYCSEKTALGFRAEIMALIRAGSKC